MDHIERYLALETTEPALSDPASRLIIIDRLADQLPDGQRIETLQMLQEGIFALTSRELG